MAEPRDSINPFPELQTEEGFSAVQQDAPTSKPGWKRVSTRQWIRDFRDHIAKYQTFPYKTIFGSFFWSFGYYPDMVPEETYQKYIAKYPPSARKQSFGSGNEALPGISETDMSAAASTTDMSAAEKPFFSTDDNANFAEFGVGTAAAAAGGAVVGGAAAAGGKKKKKAADAEDAAESARESIGGESGKTGGKGKKKKKGAAEDDAAAEDGAESARGSVGGESGKTGGKGKKKKKGAAEDEGDTASEAPAPSEGGKKKGKKKKADDAGDEGDTASEAPAPSEGGKKKGKKKKGDDAGEEEASVAGDDTASKGKKGKGKKAKPSISGNMAFDPQVYDLSTLTVMNLPAGATEAKIKKLFPGSTVKMEGGGASVTFPDAASAEQFFTKDVSLDGQSLVISPKLKA